MQNANQRVWRSAAAALALQVQSLPETSLAVPWSGACHACCSSADYHTYKGVTVTVQGATDAVPHVLVHALEEPQPLAGRQCKPEGQWTHESVVWASQDCPYAATVSEVCCIETGSCLSRSALHSGHREHLPGADHEAGRHMQFNVKMLGHSVKHSKLEYLASTVVRSPEVGMHYQAYWPCGQCCCTVRLLTGCMRVIMRACACRGWGGWPYGS